MVDHTGSRKRPCVEPYAGEADLRRSVEIYEKVSSAGTVAQRTVSQWKWTGGDYQRGKVLQTIYYTLMRSRAKPPFTKDMLVVHKVVLHYCNRHGVKIRDKPIAPPLRKP